MTIKEAAKITGISIDTLRYYERIGLIPEIPRTDSGIRDYNEQSLNWIQFAMYFKRSGMSLEAIREYFKLALQGESTKTARKEILIESKEDLEKRIMELKESLDVINYKIATYEQKCEPLTDELVRAWEKQVSTTLNVLNC